MSELGPYLQRWTRERFAWGGTDCGLGFVAGWVQASTGQDPAAALRGRYRTARGAARIVARAGGAEALYDELAHGVRWVRRDPAEARAGDVGLVVALTRRTRTGRISLSKRSRKLAGAIFTGKRWALFAERGLVVASMSSTAVWGAAD